jgi:membrane-bound serine protease (ClpP class)
MRSFLRRALLAVSLGCVLAGTLLLVAGPAPAQSDASQTLDVVSVEGVIDPTVANYLKSKLEAAEEDGVHAVVIQLDTPGGLDVSMREIIQQMLDSEVPVIVWVAPRGARAASAGTFITYAADLAYMAEATELGAATPIDLGGGDLSTKVINDSAAYIRSLAEANGRDVEFAEAAVREGASITSEEAAETGVINGLASSLGDLLRAMDGQTVTVSPGGLESVAPLTEVTLETWSEADNAPSVIYRFQDMNVMQRLLHAVTSPEVAYLLLLIGFFGIIFELYNPGIGLAGILGAICLLLGFYGLSVLPTNWVGVLLITVAVVAFIIDLQIAGFGIWTIGGVAALIGGGLILFSGADDALAVSPWAIVAAVIGSLVFFVSVMTAALRVRLRRPVTGQESIVGTIGEAQTDIAPEGTVLSKGVLWKARTMETGIAAGSKVEVKATEGLVLLVEPLHEEETSPAP